MAWIRRGILGLIGCLMVVSGQQAAGAGDSSAPYIYYYANTINALVVERADGTDSRVIAPGAMPPYNMVITDLDWSPSGEWMAWRSDTYNGPGANSFKGWISRTDGSQRLTLLDNIGLVLALEWSPTADLLYVAYAEMGGELAFDIIDPAANKIIAHTELNIDLDTWIDGFPSGWLADGTGIYFSVPINKADFVGVMKTDGTVTMQVYDSWSDITQVFSLFKGRILAYEYDFAHQKYMLTMRDLSTGKQVLIDEQPLYQTDSKVSGFRVYWDSSLRYALIFRWPCAEQGSCYYPNVPQTQLYLLDWDAGSLQFIAAWVIPPGFDDPRIGQYAGDFLSPDGHYAALRDTLNHLLVIDVHTGALFPSIEMPPYITGWDWAEQSGVLMLFSDLERQLYRYDLEQKTATPLDISIPRYEWFSLSPDGRFVGMISHHPEYNTPDMIDLKNRGKRRWAHHSLGVSAGPALDYVWRSDSRWFMTGEWSAFSSGGPGPSSVTVMDTGGTVRREISVCSAVGSCTGFVPDRAVPHLGEGSAKSVIPQPIYNLSHEGRVTGVAWSPDGGKIASYDNNFQYNSGGKITIWDVRGVPTRIAEYPAGNCFPYPTACILRWSTDGKTISMDDRKTVTIIDVDTGAVIDSHPALLAPRPVGSEPPQFISISPDGHYAIPISNSGSEFPIIDLTSGQTAASVPADHKSGVLGWSRDSQTLILEDEQQLSTWSMPDMQLRIFPLKYGEVYSVDANPDSPIIVGANLYHPAFIWNAVTGDQLADMNFYAVDVALSPDGTRLAAAGSSLVTLWDVSDLGNVG